MFISLFAVIVAAVVEHFRLENWNRGYDIHYIGNNNHLHFSLVIRYTAEIQSTKLLAILAITQAPCPFCTRYLSIV